MLHNRAYVKFAARNTVEILHMEETDKAIRDKSRFVRTYTGRDAYGDETEYLAEFPGLTLAQLERLNGTNAILRYMEGGKIPYTAIVNPHTLEQIEAIKGGYTPKALMAKVAVHRKALEKAHGKGVERKLWNEVAEGVVRIDHLLGAGKIVEAQKLCDRLAKATARRDAVHGRVESAQETILSDARKRVEVLAEQETRGATRELERLARVFAGTPLAERARALIETKQGVK